MQQFRVGLVGCGGLSSAHIPALMKMENAKIVAVCDPIAERAHAAAERAGAEITRDFDDLIARPDIDVVHILTPHYLHAPMAIAALGAGKHVLTEKPMATTLSDARAMIDAGVALALATDINPGSAPCPSMPLVMAIACRYQRILPAEALNASTINAAYAIGLGDRVGSIEVGKQADLLIVDAADYRHLAYQFGTNLVEGVIKGGHLQKGSTRP